MAARVHSMWGHWTEALHDAKKTLEFLARDEDAFTKKFDIKPERIRAVKLGATLIKAEALYNLCHFEHALVLFHRGSVSTLNDVIDQFCFNQLLRDALKTCK